MVFSLHHEYPHIIRFPLADLIISDVSCVINMQAANVIVRTFHEELVEMLVFGDSKIHFILVSVTKQKNPLHPAYDPRTYAAS